jgi:hypothetical protein
MRSSHSKANTRPVAPDRQRVLLADHQHGRRAAGFDLDREVVEHQPQEAGDAVQRRLKSRRRQHGAAQQFEAAAPQRPRKQGEALVVEAVVDQAVKRCIARDGDAGLAVVQQGCGNSCMFEQAAGAQPGTPDTRQDSLDEADRDTGRAAGGHGGRCWFQLS